MKIISFIAITFLSSFVLGDPHGLCACQVRTNGPTKDKSTQACCSRLGGLLLPQPLPAAGPIKFPGRYCQGQDISGKAFFRCCNDNGALDSTCPE